MLPPGGTEVETSKGDSATNGDVSMTATEDKQTDTKRSRVNTLQGKYFLGLNMLKIRKCGPCSDLIWNYLDLLQADLFYAGTEGGHCQGACCPRWFSYAPN